MFQSLTVRDLLLPGEPLDPGQVLAGQERLSNPVSWVVSLRPYAPALPQLRGGELALVSMEHVARLEPPTTLAAVVRNLASRQVAGVAVRGEVGGEAIATAGSLGIPLIQVAPDAPMHDIEQAIMRECALYQARREILPEEPDAWVGELLKGNIGSEAEAQALARRAGYTLTPRYSVAYIVPLPNVEESAQALDKLATSLQGSNKPTSLLAHMHGEGLVVLLPPGAEDKLRALVGGGLACGIGDERPVMGIPASLAEAQVAAEGAALLRGGVARYDQLGVDRLLVLLYREHPDELRAFVEQTLGPLLRHDSRSATPLLPTVRAFIDHGGRLRETAAEIYVHRNTLSYRLDRAAEVLSADLKDPLTRLSIELALRALPLVEEYG